MNTSAAALAAGTYLSGFGAAAAGSDGFASLVVPPVGLVSGVTPAVP